MKGNLESFLVMAHLQQCMSFTNDKKCVCKRHKDEAGKELAELRKKTTWQPIETAPKDGTTILIYDNHDNRIRMVAWENYYPGKDLHGNYVFGWREPDTEDEYGKWGIIFHCATYWMPLPELPEEVQG